MMKRWLMRLLWGTLIGSAIALAAVAWFANGSGIQGWKIRSKPIGNKTTTDQMIRSRFAGHAAGLGATAYEDAFRYLFEGYLNYRSPEGAFIFYPGAPSSNGQRVDGLEGYARFFPLAASWLAAGKSDTMQLADRSVSVTQTLRTGLLAGTRRDGPEYWGTIVSQQQRLVESADVALGLWISRDHLWATLNVDERKQVTAWLSRALQVDTFPGNWTLFPVLVHRVLTALGEDSCCHDPLMANQYRQFKTLYRGGGWFEDPPNGFDYYNAWAVHYVLFWLDQIDPSFDPEFIRTAHKDFVAFYKYLVGPQGVPMMGRSICYRMATSVPLLAAQVLAPDEVSPGWAARALDATWGHFISHGSLADGAITQGYCGNDLSILNNYSGPASCLWGTRSLVLGFYLERRLHLLDTKRDPLAVEKADFAVEATSIKWAAKGLHRSGEIVLTLQNNPGDATVPIQRYGASHQILEWLTHRPKRPDNHAAMYLRREYSSQKSAVACDLVKP